MLWYKAAVQTEQCHKVRLRNGREILVCIGTDGGQGNNATSLYSEDLLTPTTSLMAGRDDDGTFFTAFDSTLSCGWNNDDEKKPFPVVRTHIDKVEFSAAKNNGSSLVSVTAGYGTKAMSPESAIGPT